ncbi:hypothetical protein B0H10DRAFT_1969858 [Mycena sp. CBHHK59/15]|nr:hypothetical protein B0H10DRAFT_1969858 [Mycena sp. CBHHK59/15]
MIVSDTTGNVKKCRALICDTFPWILNCPDPCHQLNLLAKEIMLGSKKHPKIRGFAEIMKIVSAITTFFSHSNYGKKHLRDKLKEQDDRRGLVSFGATRFSTFADQASSVSRCLTAMGTCFSDRLIKFDRKVPVLFDPRNYGTPGTESPFFVTTIHTELRCRRFAVACPPVMDYDAFSDNAWCSGSDDWMQTQSDPTDTGSFFDENTNQLQWNRSTCNTPAPLVPDTTPITFGLEMGLTNELPFFDGFSHASCDLGSLFGHESDSANWNSGWSDENCRELRNEYMSLPSSSDYLAILPPELEALLATADPSLALGGVSAAVDSPPLHLWGSDDLPVSSSSSPTVDLTQYEISNSEAQNFLGWQWQKSSTRWLDEGVSSEVCHFPEAIKVSDRTKVSHVERVTGLPSQFPVPRAV